VKGFLIFLAVAFPVVLVSPFFWSLVRMEWGAEPVGYHYKDGVTQWAMLGPKAPWPRWAIVPEGSKLTVRARYQPAPGHPAIGYADLDGKAAPRTTVQSYQAALRCIIQAEQGAACSRCRSTSTTLRLSAGCTGPRAR
jgi:hypothetical protein